MLLPRAGRGSGGGSREDEAALLIRNVIHFSKIVLNTGLHAAAAAISLEKTLTFALCTCLPIPQFRNILLLNFSSSFRNLFSCWEISTRILLSAGIPAGMAGEDAR
ncbi:hypothetical protein PoB_006790100 [Plakobranchus ocellatus]|uniref:Uncharacterized protein n=1 Tax=Plakobranchus ocellatus TaxID=259542 RepID=A0AAV4DB82_9GAST|nr:hypothetical protein PoB_006790100 [Plakobranchus ocellatus]